MDYPEDMKAELHKISVSNEFEMTDKRIRKMFKHRAKNRNQYEQGQEPEQERSINDANSR